MKKDIDALLSARQRRHKHAVDVTLDRGLPVIIVKPNTPGIEKNTVESSIILNTASALISALFDIEAEVRTSSVDGDYHLFVVKQEGEAIKRVTVYLEDTHVLGRLMDIDVYVEAKALSRTQFGLKRRLCFICEKEAAVCARNRAHPFKEIKAYIDSKVRGFLLDALSNEVEQALLKELYLSPCFSLVGPFGSGIHKDMNISHFLTSIQTLKPHFRQYLAMGMELDKTFHKIRPLGVQGEKAMLEATHHVNTHKGAHFIFGLALPVFMDSVLRGASFDTFKVDLKAMGEYLVEKDFGKIKKPFTTGERLYKTQGIQGIRGEALKGFPGVFEWYPKKGEKGVFKLLRIMARIEDTTLIKRNLDIEGMKKALKACEEEDFKAMDKLMNTYRLASPGGAADMLAFTFFLEASDHLLK